MTMSCTARFVGTVFLLVSLLLIIFFGRSISTLNISIVQGLHNSSVQMGAAASITSIDG
jgi:hypothetical protein